MAEGSGLSGQFGIVAESTPGTPVAVTRFIEINSDTLALRRVMAQGLGLRAGGRFPESSRRVVAARDAGGDVVFDFPSKGAGLFLKYMIGSSGVTAVQSGATAAYVQTHTDGTLNGQSFTAQKGVPDTTGTVQAFTYPGCKVDAWTLTAAQNAILQCSLTLDAWDELIPGSGVQALQAASVPTSHVFHFAQASLTLAGTASTSAGITTVASGVAVPNVRSFTLTGDNKIATDRWYIGGAGKKAEQLENDFMAYTGEIDVDFAGLTQYNQYTAEANLVLHLSFVGPLIATGLFETLDIILPAIRLEDGGSPPLNGPDIVSQKFPFTVLDDQSGTNPRIQMQYTSTDTVV